MSLATKSLTIAAVVLAAACAIDTPTNPSGGRAVSDRGRDKPLPGSSQTFAATGRQPNNCIPANPSYGSALIGPSGGDLMIGTTRLTIPAGALTEKVQISATIPDGKPLQVDFQPHGLQFKKAAGLIIDASSCTNVPNIVYLIDQFTTSDPIVATYSNWWHTIACPIWHFSGYSIAFNDDGSGAAE